MAGEVEEPFSLSFQAISIHSGSISFGRFEGEGLSWERRSSFSHNRYLEEVEKYSKPGLVTEKKAYFEAHFKRKGLLSESSSESLGGIDYQTSENDISENMGFRKEFEQINDGSHFAQFDKSSDGSENVVVSEVMGCDREDIGVSYVEPQFESALNNAENDLHLPTNSHTTMEDDKTTTVPMTTMDDSPKLERLQDFPPKVGAEFGSKLVKLKSKSQVNFTLVQKNRLPEPSKDSAKKPTIGEREGSQSSKTKKHPTQRSASNIHSVPRISKLEGCTNSKSKVIYDNRSSEKDVKIKKICKLTSEEVVLKAQQTTNRSKQTEQSRKSGLKHSSAVSNLRSDEQAEKAEAETKQFCKSLTFKATPMPSFYYEAVHRGPVRNKEAVSSTKSNKLRNSSTPEDGADGRSSSYAKNGNYQSPFNAEPGHTSDPPQSSAATNCSRTSVTLETGASFQTPFSNRDHPPQDDMKKINTTGIRGHSKEIGTKLQKHRVSGSSEMTKDQRFDGKHTLEAGRIKNKMVRKDMKGAGIGCASGMGHLAVGVAS